MKKVSTVAAAQRRNISQQKLTVGLDLGDRNSWYCVLDESGHVVVEQRVSTTTKAIDEAAILVSLFVEISHGWQAEVSEIVT
jgi:transposase